MPNPTPASRAPAARLNSPASPNVAPRTPDRPGPGASRGGRVVLFFCLFGLLAFGTNLLIDSGLRRIPTSDFGVMNRIVAGEINADILVSGSSRALTHYDTRTIERVTGQSAFNIGLNGSQTDMQLAVLKTYLKHNRRPRLVIHNLDPSAFAVSHEIYDPAQYMPYLGEETLYGTLRRLNPKAWRWKYLPLYGYTVEDMRFTWMTGLRAWMGSYPAEDRHLGFQPRATAWTGDFAKFKAANPSGVEFPLDAQGMRDLEEIAALCQREKIPLIFVFSPEYHEMQAMGRNRRELFLRFSEICTRHQATLWDYSDSPLCLRQEFFYNSQHLNAEGASRFSQDLSRRLSESGLKSVSVVGESR